jgi:alcohol dehydrogenase YqhD (iron-dependent ADH family)
MGIGKAEQISNLLNSLEIGKSILLVSDKGVVNAGIVRPIQTALEESGYSVELFDSVSQNPRDTECLAGASIFREIGMEAVVAIGGGSAMDTGKAIALLGRNGGTPISFSQLIKAIVNAWKFTRSGTKIEAIIQDVLSTMKVKVTKEEKGVFVWKDEEQYHSYTAFRKQNIDRRTLQDISKVEIANGVMEIMKTALRLPKSELVREILKQLGYNRTLSQAEVYVQAAIDFNIEKGLIIEDKEGYVEVMR